MQNFEIKTLKSAVTGMLRGEATIQKAVSSYTEQQQHLLTATVETLVMLKNNFSSGNSIAVFKALLPLGKDKIEALFNSRLYAGNEYGTLSQLVSIKWDKEFIAISPKVTAEQIAKFFEAENGLIVPKATNKTTKTKTLNECITTIEQGSAIAHPEKAAKVELTENQKIAKKIKSAISSLEKAFLDARSKELLDLLHSLSEKATPFAEKLAKQDVFSSDEEGTFSIEQPTTQVEQQAA